MNAVEIEEAVSELLRTDYDAAKFPYAFLEAFGNKAATIKRLRSTGKNTTNKSDVDAKLRSWAEAFPYVNGGLFGSSGSSDHQQPSGRNISAGGVSHRLRSSSIQQAQRATLPGDDVPPAGLAVNGASCRWLTPTARMFRPLGYKRGPEA